MKKAKRSTSLRVIPAVEKVLKALGAVDVPRPAVVALIRRELAGLREQKEIPDLAGIEKKIRSALEALRRSRIQPVINGTGIVIHTNLGRSPLGTAVVATLTTIGADYNNLEFDLNTGERGGRASYLENNLALLCGAEAATVVNNCAAALVLILRHFTSGDRKEVILSRGELVQIGGGFRIPEILQASGATLREVGSTNKTTLADYEKAASSKSALLLKVHQSNFFMSGFVASPSTEELAGLAARKKLPFVEDLGSGAMIKTETISGLEHEPTPAEVLRHGVHLVCFSGDKLLGGPQAGIIAGQEKLVRALKQEPFYRALRCDKLILSALQTTVDLYLDSAAVGDGMWAIPALEMMQSSLDSLRRRAEKIISSLQHLPIAARLGDGEAQVGGGTLPRSNVRSVTVDLSPKNISVAELAARLRTGLPPVVGYISGGQLKLDLRTVFPRQDQSLTNAIQAVVAT